MISYVISLTWISSKSTFPNTERAGRCSGRLPNESPRESHDRRFNDSHLAPSPLSPSVSLVPSPAQWMTWRAWTTLDQPFPDPFTAESLFGMESWCLNSIKKMLRITCGELCRLHANFNYSTLPIFQTEEDLGLSIPLKEVMIYEPLCGIHQLPRQ